MMDVVTIERDFTSWLAQKLGLEIDKSIFRGGIPEKLEEGVGVLFGAEVPVSGFYGFRPRTWNTQEIMLVAALSRMTSVLLAL